MKQKSIELLNDEINLDRISSKASDQDYGHQVITMEPTSQNEEPINATETEEDDSWWPESKIEQFCCVLCTPIVIIMSIACLPVACLAGCCYAITGGKMSDENE